MRILRLLPYLVIDVLVLSAAALSCSTIQKLPPTALDVISCTADHVVRRAPAAIPLVNSLLTNGESPDCDGACKLELARLVANLGEDVVACVIRRQGVEYAGASVTDPRDTVSPGAATRARAIIAEKGWRFEGGVFPAPGAGPGSAGETRLGSPS